MPNWHHKQSRRASLRGGFFEHKHQSNYDTNHALLFGRVEGYPMGERAVKDRAHRTLAGENVARRAGRPRVVDSSVLLDSLVVLDGLGGDRGGDFGGIGYLGVRGSRSNGTGGFAGSECHRCHKLLRTDCLRSSITIAFIRFATKVQKNPIFA